MNYIGEINSFERWLETHYLPAQSQLLWYKLIALFNRCGWAEWVTVDNQRLMGLIQCQSKNTFLRARDSLIEEGLLEYQKGKKGTPNRYRLIPFGSKNELKTEPYVELYMEPQTEPYVEPFPEPYTGPINKHKLNKTEKKESKKETDGVKTQTGYQSIIDSFTSDPSLQEAIWGFIQMRINSKRKPTDKALELMLKRLTSFSSVVSEQIEILNKSTISNWSSIYPIKADELPKKKDETEPKYDYDKIQARMREKMWGS